MFEYRITWYNEVDDKEESIRGLVCGKTYGEAAEAVLYDYGENGVIDLYLQALEDTNTIELDTIKEQFKL